MLEIMSNEAESSAKIIVIGVGGAGNNAVNRMVEEAIGGVEFVGVNTDKQALTLCKAPTVLQIGEKITKGLGAGAQPEVGQKAAEESIEEVKQLMEGAGICYLWYGRRHRYRCSTGYRSSSQGDGYPDSWCRYEAFPFRGKNTYEQCSVRNRESEESC